MKTKIWGAHSILHATMKDLETVVLFFDENQHNVSQNGFVSSRVIERQIRLGTVDMFVVETDVLGVAIYSKGFKRLFNLLVRKDVRKNGVGKALLEYRHPLFVRCKTNMKSGNSQKFYENQGYKPLAEIKNGILLMSKEQHPISDYLM